MQNLLYKRLQVYNIIKISYRLFSTSSKKPIATRTLLNTINKHKPYTIKLDFERSWNQMTSLIIILPNVKKCIINSTFHPTQSGIRHFVRNYVPTLRYHNPNIIFTISKPRDTYKQKQPSCNIEIYTQDNKVINIDCCNKTDIKILNTLISDAKGIDSSPESIKQCNRDIRPSPPQLPEPIIFTSKNTPDSLSILDSLGYDIESLKTTS